MSNQNVFRICNNIIIVYIFIGITELKEKLSEGDLVWGPVRGSPAWPGKLVGPISPGGRALVRWFGINNSPTKVKVSQLQSLSQGLDAHHRASNKGRK